MASTGTQGRQGGKGGNQGRQTNQGNQGGGRKQDPNHPTGTVNDGRGQVKNPETDGRIGNNTNPGNRNNEPQQQRTDDLQETLGQQDDQQPQAQQGQQIDPASDPRMFVANKIMEHAIEQLALAGRMFKEIDGESGQVDPNVDNPTYADGCYKGLQQVIGESMDSLDQERNQA